MTHKITIRALISPQLAAQVINMTLIAAQVVLILKINTKMQHKLRGWSPISADDLLVL